MEEEEEEGGEETGGGDLVSMTMIDLSLCLSGGGRSVFP